MSSMTRPNRVTQPQLNYKESSDDEINDSEFEKYRGAFRRARKHYTHQDLETLLKAECPDEFNLIPNINTITFISTTTAPTRLQFVPTCNKHLHFGNIDSPILEYRDSAFIHIGGEGNNRIFMAGGKDHGKVELAQAVLVDPVKPFWYLCSHGRVIDAAEMKRMRALACFFFLASGHVQAVQHYPDFNEELVDAVVWYGRGLEVESRNTTKKADHNSDTVEASKTTAITDKQRRGECYLASGLKNDLPVGAVGEQFNTVVRIEYQPPNKKRKFSDARATSAVHTSAMTKMWRSYKQLGADMATYERECAAMEHDQTEIIKLKQNAASYTKEHDDLKVQLSVEGTKIKSMNVKYEQLQEKNKTLTQRVADLTNYGDRTYKSYKQEISKTQEETKKRIEAEKRVEGILDAQKKITAMYSGLGK